MAAQTGEPGRAIAALQKLLSISIRASKNAAKRNRRQRTSKATLEAAISSPKPETRNHFARLRAGTVIS